jgi:putative tryptophan/tyrosine transport system substrate-binding protein
MELLKEIAPRVARVAILYKPTTAPYAEIYIKPFKAAADCASALDLESMLLRDPLQNPFSTVSTQGGHGGPSPPSGQGAADAPTSSLDAGRQDHLKHRSVRVTRRSR